MPFRLRLPCALFGHKARREAVWNHGFYFATCSRCEHDIIRIPGEKWHRPRHARVVWSTGAPASAREPRLSREHHGPLQAWSELPANSRISGPAAREIRHGRQVAAAVSEQRRSAIPDFMADPDAPMEIVPKRAAPERFSGPRPVPARPVRVA